MNGNDVRRLMGEGQAGRNSRGTPPPGWRPKGSRFPNGWLRLVACLDCGAEVGEPCTTTGGSANTNVHVSRRRMSLRAAREQEGYDRGE